MAQERRDFRRQDPRQRPAPSAPPATSALPAPTKPAGLPARFTNADQMKDVLARFKDQFQKALGKVVGVDHFVTSVMLNVTANPALMNSDPKSFMRAVMNSAILQIEPGTPLQHAHLVPFWNSSKNCYEVVFMIGYRGYIELSSRSGKIGSIYGRIVYENEKYQLIGGTKDDIIHSPLPPSKRGLKRIGVYAVANLVGGGHPITEWMWAEEVEEIKRKALAKKKNLDDSPWNTNEDAMWLKSPIRRMAKRLPLSPAVQKAALAEEYQEEGRAVPWDPDIDLSLQDVPEPESMGVQGKTNAKTEDLKDKLKQDMATENQAGGPVFGPQADNETGDPGPSEPGTAGQEFQPANQNEPPLPPEPPQTNQARGAATSAPPPVPPAGGGPSSVPPTPKPASKPADYWLPDKSKVKCPPGGLNEGYLVLPANCKTKCYMIKNCVAWKE